MSDGQESTCPHVTSVGSNTWADVHSKRQDRPVCDSCQCPGPNLWLCLHARCLYVGCGESAQDHSTTHSQSTDHHITLNLTTLRIWCYSCECEVMRDNNNPPLIMGDCRTAVPAAGGSNQRSSSSLSLSSYTSPLATPSPAHSMSGSLLDDSDSDDDSITKPRGLTGLQNLGNTCYMNAAVQTLSNCPPLTRYFLDCAGYVRPEKKPHLSRSFMRLLQEMWHKKRPSYVVPSSVVQGIKYVHPMFRGYTQQDAQEFLRCFMDQIHEELKQPVAPVDASAGDTTPCCTDDTDDSDESPIGPAPRDHSANQSDTEYETCDSGLSSERSSIEHSPSSGDEETKPQQPTDTPTHVSRSRRGKRDKNRVNPEDKSDPAISGKRAKEDANRVYKLAGRGGEGGDREVDSGEFSDAVSEMEPLRGPAKEMRKTEQKSPKTATKSDTTKLVNSPKRGGKKKSPEYRSVISDVFDGKLLSSVQCLTCERVSSTKETFQDLSLPIPSKDHLPIIHANQSSSASAGGHKGTCGEVSLNQGGLLSWMFAWMKSFIYGPSITLQDCLAAFFSEDELKGDNMYSCDKCNKLRNGKKYSKVLNLPEILCIHLKRFRHEFMFSTKINSPVAFPLENLDMRPYLHKDCNDLVTSYDLIGVICHHGTAGGGHYTAYALNYISDQWYEFDDQYVTEVESHQVEHRDAYVLFYRKSNQEMSKVRQRAEQLSENEEHTFLKYYISQQWLNRFNTFTQPGPISNYDFVCRHGGVHPYKWSHIAELVQEVPEKLWVYLMERFGGGPTVNHLYQCTTCQQEIDRLRKRQKTEMDTFLRLQEAFQADDSPAAVYAISLQWFKEWEMFVREKRDEPPGAIDNAKICVVKSGHATVRPKSEYGQISSAMWTFLLDIYGGGPEINLNQSRPATLANIAATANSGQEHSVQDRGDPGR